MKTLSQDRIWHQFPNQTWFKVTDGLERFKERFKRSLFSHFLKIWWSGYDGFRLTGKGWNFSRIFQYSAEKIIHLVVHWDCRERTAHRRRTSGKKKIKYFLYIFNKSFNLKIHHISWKCLKNTYYVNLYIILSHWIGDNFLFPCIKGFM